MRKGLAYEPDLVLLQITLNDPPTHLSADTLTRELKKYTALERHPLIRHSRLLGLVVERLRTRHLRRFHVEFHRDLWDSPESWKAFAEGIESMRDECRRASAEFVAVLFPLLGHPLGDDYPFADIHERVRGLHERLGVPFLDLRPAFDGMVLSQLHIQGRDTHPNEIAHRIAAEQIYLWLESTGVLPSHVRIPRKFSTRQTLQRIPLGPTR